MVERKTSALLRGAFLLFILLHAAGSFLFPESIWGAHHLRFVPMPVLVLWLVLCPLFLLPPGSGSVVRASELLLRALRSERFLRRSLIPLTALLLFLVCRSRNLFLGDSMLLRSVVVNPEETGIGSAGFGSLLLHKILFRMGRSVLPSLDGGVPFVATSVICGVLLLVLTSSVVKELVRDFRSQAVLYVAMVFSGGILFYFGYVEHYPVMQLAVLFYLYHSVRYLRGKGRFLAPTVALLAAVVLHISALALAPSWIFLPLLARRQGKREILFLLLLIVLAALGGGLAILQYTDRYYQGMDALIPFMDKGNHSYTFFSRDHASFVINELLLLLGGAILLSFLRLPGRGEGDRTVRCFLIVAASLGLLYLLLVDPRLGARDWDLMAVVQYPLLALLGHLSLAGRSVPGRGAVALVIGAVMLHTGPWVAANLDRDRSVEMILAMVSRDPHYANPAARAPKSLGVLFSRAGYDEAAGRLYERAVTAKEDAQNFFNLGTNYAKRGKPEEAVPLLRRAIELEPLYVDAYSNLAVVLRKLDRLEEAELVLRTLIGVAPDHANGHFLLGTLLYRTNRNAESIDLLRRSLELDSLRVEAWADLGMVYARTGNTTAAREAIRKALELDPDSEMLRSYLADLERQ